MDETNEAARLTDEELSANLPKLALDERSDLVALLKHLAVFDERKLYSAKHTSLFDYCRKILRYSESAAGKRIYAARALRDFPKMQFLLQSGELHLEAVVMLRPHLTQENHLS